LSFGARLAPLNPALTPPQIEDIVFQAGRPRGSPSGTLCRKT
jgi:hypothetical protein